MIDSNKEMPVRKLLIYVLTFTGYNYVCNYNKCKMQFNC